MLKTTEKRFLENGLPIPTEETTIQEVDLKRSSTEIVERALCLILTSLAAEGCPIEGVKIDIQKFSLADKLIPIESRQCNHEITDWNVECEHTYRLHAGLALFRVLGILESRMDHEMDMDEEGKTLNRLLDYQSASELASAVKLMPADWIAGELDYYINYWQAYMESGSADNAIGNLSREMVMNIAMALIWLVECDKKWEAVLSRFGVA